MQREQTGRIDFCHCFVCSIQISKWVYLRVLFWVSHLVSEFTGDSDDDAFVLSDHQGISLVMYLIVEEPMPTENTADLNTSELPVPTSQKREEPEESEEEGVAVKPDAKQKKKERLEELKVLS